jgi:glycosyltransferase involved in cell wall biosynthesis
MRNDMISVIIPIYNDQDFLETTLTSVLSQTYKDFEVICVDDGSTDFSLQMATEIAKVDSRLKVFSKKNGGVSSARNLGLKVAQGEFIFFMDGDDNLPPDALRTLLSLIKKDESDAAVGQIAISYEAHEELKESDLSYYKIERAGVFDVSDHLIDSFHSSSCGILFRKRLIENHNLSYPEGLHYEDAYWHWVYFSKCKKVSFTKEVVYNYVRHSSSIMSSTFEGKESLAIQHLFIGEEILTFWQKEGELNQHLAIAGRIIETYFWFAIRFSQQFEKSRVAYECGRILRKFNIDVSKSELLSSLSKGDLGFLYADNTIQNVDSSYARYLQLKTLFDKYFPRRSWRRKKLYSIGRRIYKILR